MADIVISVEAKELLEALDGLSVKDAFAPFVKAAARVSADHICADAIARLERQLVAGVGKGFGGHPTGEAVAGITVKSDRKGWGWIVNAADLSQPMLDRWLENSTKLMPARPFFWDSARLEEQAHRDRMGNAIQACLSQYGLGDGQS